MPEREPARQGEATQPYWWYGEEIQRRIAKLAARENASKRRVRRRIQDRARKTVEGRLDTEQEHVGTPDPHAESP